MTIEELYQQRAAAPSDIVNHMPTLRRLADACETVVEFGVRSGNSTVAFLASKAKRVVSFDIEAPQFSPSEMETINGLESRWEFHLADTAHMSSADFPRCDLLFIDTRHTAAQVAKELTHAQAALVDKFVVLHDTHLFGCCDEGQPGQQIRGVGILTPVLIFLTQNPFSWRVKSHTPACCGLTVLERRWKWDNA